MPYQRLGASSSARLRSEERAAAPAQQRSAVQCRAGRCPTVPSRALQVPCRAVLCHAVPCCAMRCHAVPCAVPSCVLCYLYFFFTPSIIRSVIPPILLLYEPGIKSLNRKRNALTAQLSPAVAQHRSAAPCGAILCGAVPTACLLLYFPTCQESFEVSYRPYYCCTYQLLYYC